MNNSIIYVAPKNKTVAHSMSPNNKISCVVGIFIFVFKKYWQRVLNLLDLSMIPNFKQFLQDETENAKENKTYYQRYNVKIMRVFHKQAMIKHKIYENILARKSGMDYIPGIHFQKFLSTQTKKKYSPRTINRKKRTKRKEDGAGLAP